MNCKVKNLEAPVVGTLDLWTSVDYQVFCIPSKKFPPALIALIDPKKYIVIAVHVIL
jgi:hypothetical protein